MTYLRTLIRDPKIGTGSSERVARKPAVVPICEGRISEEDTCVEGSAL